MKKISILVLILAAVAGSILFFWNDIAKFYFQFSINLPQIRNGVNDFINLEFVQPVGQIFTPAPLRSSDGENAEILTRVGVIEWTNNQREKNGLTALQENPELDASAAIKAEDMIQKQYFAHDSPSGIGAADLAKTVGYKFIVLGENLALGNFKNDEGLVQAWMDSPGHRANILNVKYQEIGVAVIKGSFEGKTVWFSVQHFGEPFSACPEPDSDTKMKIQMGQKQILMLQTNLDLLKNELQNTWPRQGSAYNQKFEEYNTLISQYNSLLTKNKNLTEEYNSQVQAFNVCAGAGE